MSDDVDAFFIRPEPRRSYHDALASELESHVARKRRRTRPPGPPEPTVESSHSRPLTIDSHVTSVHDPRYSLAALAAQARRDRGLTEVSQTKATADLTRGGPARDDVGAGKRAIRIESPRRTVLSDVRNLQGSDSEDLAFSDFDEDYLDHTSREKVAKNGALARLREKRKEKHLKATHADVDSGRLASLQQEALLGSARSRCHRPDHAVQLPSSTRESRVPVHLTDAPCREKKGSLRPLGKPQARRLEFGSLARRADPSARPLPSASRHWATALKEVPASHSAPLAGTSKHSGPSNSVIDVDEAEMQAEAGDDSLAASSDDDAIDAAFGMDKLSPNTRKAFLRIAGMADEEDDRKAGPSTRLNDKWDFMEQENERQPAKSRGKTWASRGGRKPWFRKGRGGWAKRRGGRSKS